MENNRNIYCFCRKPSLGNMIAYDNSNVNLSGFIIAVLTSVGQLTGSYIAKFKKKGKRRTAIYSSSLPKSVNNLRLIGKPFFPMILSLPECSGINVMAVNRWNTNMNPK